VSLLALLRQLVSKCLIFLARDLTQYPRPTLKPFRIIVVSGIVNLRLDLLGASCDLFRRWSSQPVNHSFTVVHSWHKSPRHK